MKQYRGPYPDSLWVVLGAAHEKHVACQSDFARAASTYVALAASLGWITTISPDGLTHGGRWAITASGLYALTHREHFTS